MNNHAYIRSIAMHPLPLLSPEGGIAFNSCVTLSRNIEGVNFPIQANDEQRNYVLMHVFSSLQNRNLNTLMRQIPLNGLALPLRNILFERHLIPILLNEKRDFTAFSIDESEKLSVIINADDHVCIQSISDGYSIDETLKNAIELEKTLSLNLVFAYDKRWGYLTSRPTLVGSGLKIKVRMHLPALVATQKIAPMIAGIKKLNMSIHALLGDNEHPIGALYEVSNLSTLGETLDEMKQRLESVVKALIQAEKSARIILHNEEYHMLLNQISRAYGTLKYAHELTVKEMFESLSLLWLGVELNLFSELTIQDINILFTQGQNGHLACLNDDFINSSEALDVARAKLFREYLRSKLR